VFLFDEISKHVLQRITFISKCSVYNVDVLWKWYNTTGLWWIQPSAWGVFFKRHTKLYRNVSFKIFTLNHSTLKSHLLMVVLYPDILPSVVGTLILKDNRLYVLQRFGSLVTLLCAFPTTVELASNSTHIYFILRN
jgi:hypothetical protein